MASARSPRPHPPARSPWPTSAAGRRSRPRSMVPKVSGPRSSPGARRRRRGEPLMPRPSRWADETPPHPQRDALLPRHHGRPAAGRRARRPERPARASAFRDKLTDPFAWPHALEAHLRRRPTRRWSALNTRRRHGSATPRVLVRYEFRARGSHELLVEPADRRPDGRHRPDAHRALRPVEHPRGRSSAATALRSSIRRPGSYLAAPCSSTYPFVVRSVMDRSSWRWIARRKRRR